MIRSFFHRWEQRLADVSRDERVVRPFDWGVDWMPDTHAPADSSDPRRAIREWVDEVMGDTDAFFTPTPTTDYTLVPASEELQAGGEAGTLVFPSGYSTPHPENNTVYARFFPSDCTNGFGFAPAAGSVKSA